MRAHYDFTASRPSPYAKRLGARGRKVLVGQFLRSENLVRIDGDVAQAFPDEASVNAALRLLLKLRGLTSPDEPKRAKPGDKRSAPHRAAGGRA